MSKHERNQRDREPADGILDADDTGLVRNEVEIVQEEIEEGLSSGEVSPEELPVDGRGPEGRPVK
jgi:hypothetical protein